MSTSFTVLIVYWEMRVRLLFSNKKKETVEREWSQVVICELSTPLSELEYPTIRRVCSRYLRVKLNWNENFQ